MISWNIPTCLTFIMFLSGVNHCEGGCYDHLDDLKVDKRIEMEMHYQNMDLTESLKSSLTRLCCQEINSTVCYVLTDCLNTNYICNSKTESSNEAAFEMVNLQDLLCWVKKEFEKKLNVGNGCTCKSVQEAGFVCKPKKPLSTIASTTSCPSEGTSSSSETTKTETHEPAKSTENFNGAIPVVSLLLAISLLGNLLTVLYCTFNRSRGKGQNQRLSSECRGTI